jgi:hypothetical protein
MTIIYSCNIYITSSQSKKRNDVSCFTRLLYLPYIDEFPQPVLEKLIFVRYLRKTFDLHSLEKMLKIHRMEIVWIFIGNRMDF